MCKLVSLHHIYICSLCIFFGSFSSICLFLFCYHIFLDASLYFNEKERTDVDFGGWERREELGGIGGGERVIRIYCMEKIYF